MPKRMDNVTEPIYKQDGAYTHIDMSNLKNVHKQCDTNHQFEIDVTEVSKTWQGYKCIKCGRGELKPL